MHLHVLGICGTFMGGLAALAREAGHRVTGCDANVYPPMSDQLKALGIELIEGYDASQLQLAPDLFVVGNTITRGNPLMEAILDANARYTSGPQWLAEQILAGRHVLAVAGTHGKTGTTSMLAWILEEAGLDPGFLVGGVPLNFGVSARLGAPGAPFVIEADEYDTAFFDKRSKFVHYRPRTAILNNLEFDHADIFDDLAAIERQFHHLVRTVPSRGRIIVNAREEALQRVLAMGCWSEVQRFGGRKEAPGMLRARGEPHAFDVLRGGLKIARVEWTLLGEHNQLNALAAMAAAEHIGVVPEISARALAGFRNVRRRLELRGVAAGVSVYDDFAHHPTAIHETLAAMRKGHPDGRLWAVFEPRSATACRRVFQDDFAHAFIESGADETILAPVFRSSLPEAERLSVDQLVADISTSGRHARVLPTVDDIVATIAAEAQPGDRVVIMSNGGFGGIHGKLLDALAR
jgi:UDP-N-acetylmuramate: L-alanyl-gamma-D-glutamyl-meso-diaminopimelate ligase